MSPVPDPNAWAVDALTVSWENLDMYVFPSVVTGQGGQQIIRPSLQEGEGPRLPPLRPGFDPCDGLKWESW